LCNNFFFNITSENKKKQVSTHPFIPTGPAKHHSTAGDHFGTFGPKLSGSYE